MYDVDVIVVEVQPTARDVRTVGPLVVRVDVESILTINNE